ncbi:hypothetical protein [Sinosporangium siamense]|uniref:DUF1648 domain-containing protein n=1 Tax=Sinosporangium siamense TaxID=1367973 RepID=A0A919RAJ3_9ACTN|nr:hypothetical protein [Sinosporangium siamense]GII90158.1 hypothetical protein Ssi02_03890 [Sinosporangium siamense]
MTDRTRALAVAVPWGALVAAAILAVPAALSDRLPDPLATHWGSSGIDGTTSATGMTVFTLLFWLLPWAVLVGVMLFAQPRTRAGRSGWWASLVGWGLLTVSMTCSIVYANLDAPEARLAGSPGWDIALVLAVAFGGAALAGFLGRGAPDQPNPAPADLPTVRLHPGRRTVWVGRVVSLSMIISSVIGVAVVVVAGATMLVGLLPADALWIMPGLLLIAVAGAFTGTVRVRIGEHGLAIGFGPFGWPGKHIPLDRIESAWTEQRTPAQVGGWGWRGLPGNTTLMLRGGECLVVAETSGKRVAVSVDDAARGASLLNALAAERSHHVA